MKKLCLGALAFFCVPVLAADRPLFETMALLDAAVFESFNACDNAQELNKHAAYFAVDVEFYHDAGGVTWDRDTMIANTKQFACGNYTRELVAGSLSDSPIKDFGAITTGEHIFCQTKTKTCEGKADFVMVWRNIQGNWQITRVLSYGHRENM
ncbi:hypothetical protein R50072_35310 [Simiduia litorea]|uniref:nuclear transport factor 2 family protein n=1 Tax=Simiduia litorea TaxID=1435348 RepID=UPI0036F19E58